MKLNHIKGKNALCILFIPYKMNSYCYSVMIFVEKIKKILCLCDKSAN